MPKPTRLELIRFAICAFGLKMHPAELSKGELRDMDRSIGHILRKQEGVPTHIIVEAIEHGMRGVWPFSEDARPFDAEDVSRHLLKAKGFAATKRRQGLIPVTGIRPPDEGVEDE